MLISSLSLTNFRNYRSLELSLPPGVSVFAGQNAQGKTNVLEAVYLLATLRSPRTESDAELVAWNTIAAESGPARIKGAVTRIAGVFEVELQLVGRGEPSPDSAMPTPVSAASRRIRVNGLPRKAGEAAGILNAVFFSTLDIDLITGSPSVRRRYIDLTLTQVDARYREHLAEYAKVMPQRNALLKLVQERRADARELDFWDARLARSGAYITSARARAILELDRLAQLEEDALTSGGEVLTIRYLPRIAGTEAGPLADVAVAEELLTHALEAGRRRDVDSGMTLTGPHRDDLELLVGGVSAGAFGSRAQQRTAALALRLAEARLLEGRTGEPPVLLLDDILSEMDATRRASVLSRIDDTRQVLITTAEPEVFAPEFMAAARQFLVRAGTVTPADAPGG